MKNLILTAIIACMAYWGYENQVHDDLKELYNQWNNEQVRSNTLNRIESKITSFFLNLPYKPKFNMDGYLTGLTRNEEIDSFAVNLVKDCRSNREKAKAIYSYITRNIVYDYDYEIYDADRCFTEKKGVCKAYSELFVQMATAVGVNSVVVTGYAKDRIDTDELERHAWVLIEDDNGNYYPADPCWDAVKKDDDGHVTRPARWNWFDKSPEMMIFSHHPNLEWQQLLEKKVSLDLFKKLPFMDAEDVSHGIDPKDFLNRAHRGEILQLPSFYTSNIDYSIIRIPYTDRLEIGKSYDFSFKTKRPMKMAVLVNDEWTACPTTKKKLHNIAITPTTKGKVSIAFAEKDTYNYIISYQIN